MILHLETTGLPIHKVSDTCLAVEQALLRYGPAGRVSIEAELLRDVLEALAEHDFDASEQETRIVMGEYAAVEEDAEKALEETEKKLADMETEKDKFKGIVVDLVTHIEALRKNKDNADARALYESTLKEAKEAIK